MRFSEFEALGEQTRHSNPTWFELDSDAPASDSQIMDAEEKLRVRLPDEYRAFLKTYGGGYFAFAVIYSVAPNSDWNVCARNHADRFEHRDFVAISDNGAGDYYGFRHHGGRCNSRITVWDHETNRLTDTEYDDLFGFLAKAGLKT